VRTGGKQGKAPSRKSTRKDWLPWVELGLAILITGAALFFHFTFFTHAGALWRDEVNSVQFASMPSVSSTYESLKFDSFPVLSTLLLRGWIGMGLGSDQSLRMYGLLAGALLLCTLWLTCRLFGCSVPLISVALVGLNPWVVRTADSIRPYGIGTALIVATLGCVWKAVETSRPKWFVIAALFAALSVQCMYQNAVLLLAICLAAAIVSLRGSRIKTAIGVVLVGLAAALSLVLYLPSIAAAHSWGVIVRSPISVKRLLDVLVQALGPGSVATVWLWSGLAILSCWVGIRALLSRSRQPAAMARSDLALFCAIVLLSAGAMYFMALKASQLFVMPWYYVPLAVMVAPTLDATAWLVATTDRWRIIRLAVVLAIACTMAIPGWRQSHERWTNVDVVASKIGESAAAGDVIVLAPFWLAITFQRYYKGPAKFVTIPPLEDVHIARYDLVKAAMGRPGAVDPALETMAKALQSGHRVWWVAGIPLGPHNPPPLPPAPLPGSGWNIGPYLHGWARQAANFLESHCLQADQVDVRASGLVTDYENVVLMTVSGWR
jgi:hypothetical protein